MAIHGLDWRREVGRLFLLFNLFTYGSVFASPEDLPASGLEVMAELNQGPGNITVTPAGRIIISQHQFFKPELRVVEVLPDGRTVPFPNRAWSSAPGDDGIGLHSVLGLRADRRGVVWMLDNGGEVPRVVAWDTVADRLHRVIPIPPPATRPGSMHNDLAVDLVHNAIYIADFGGDRGPALVVIDLNTGQARRLLEGHASVQAEDITMVIDGRPVRVGSGDEVREARVGVNPITLDPTNRWVYYGAMHGRSIYRLRTRDLLVRMRTMAVQQVRGLAKAFGVPRARVTLLGGQAGRNKRLLIRDPDKLPPSVPRPTKVG